MIEKNKEPQKNRIKQFLNSKRLKYYFLCLILSILAILAMFAFLKRDFLKGHISFIKNGKVAENSINLYEKEPNLKEKLDEISNSIYIANESILNNSNLIKEIQVELKYLKDLQSQNLIEPQKLELIKLILKIQDDINKNLSYSTNLRSFEKLVLNDSFLQEYINILKKYQNLFPTKDIIFQEFSSELQIFIKEHNILVENKNNVNSFLSNFITITKVKNHEKFDSNKFITLLEKAILTHNYIDGYDILKNNSEYIKSFNKTFYNLEILFNLNNSVENIINYLINNK